jgi:hypothetical protein
VALTEDECWAIDHQIRCDLTVNGKPVGRAILLKVFRALTEYANERDSESGVLHLGTLADLLRPPGEEDETDGSDESPGGPQAGGAADSRQEHEGPGTHPPDDAPGALPRGK